MFRSLRGFNYRVWACGALVSNVGTWMQRVAQGWLVLTQLTHNNATAGVGLWHVYVFAFALGCVTAFDSPARHTFVAELVGEDDLANAVALNSTSFNAARMIGPAIAGTLIASVGSGWVFLINAASFVAVLCSLALLRLNELHAQTRAVRTRGSLVEGFRYVWR